MFLRPKNSFSSTFTLISYFFCHNSRRSRKKKYRIIHVLILVLVLILFCIFSFDLNYMYVPKFFLFNCIKVFELNGHCGHNSEQPVARPNVSIVSRINWPMWAAKCHFVGVEYCHTNDNVVDLIENRIN